MNKKEKEAIIKGKLEAKISELKGVYGDENIKITGRNINSYMGYIGVAVIDNKFEYLGEFYRIYVATPKTMRLTIICGDYLRYSDQACAISQAIDVLGLN